MLAFQQQTHQATQQQQQRPSQPQPPLGLAPTAVSASAGSASAIGSALAASTAAAAAAVAIAPPSQASFGKSRIGTWNSGSKPSDQQQQYSSRSYAAGGGSGGGSSSYRLHAGGDSHSLSRTGNPRSSNGRSQQKQAAAFAAPHWRSYHNHYVQHHQQQQQHHHANGTGSGSGVSTGRRQANRHGNNSQHHGINQLWRQTNANANANANANGSANTGLTINTDKARDVPALMSSTYQGTDSPLLSGISLALSKQKNQQQQPAVPSVKVVPPLYDVPQPRTPHPLSPADSLKTPGYVDPESLPFPLGSMITDSSTGKQYKLLGVLGEGSYAVVYLARCTFDNAKYALKCLSKLGLTARQLSLQRSELEIHAAVCPHPHIVTLYSYFETRDWLFLIMERVSGPDLYDYITQHPAFNANQEERRFVEATRLFEQMIDAVAHIHALKAYHRDLKPENFILGADGNLKLTDFGLATRESLSTDFECGSKPYMSYENRNGGLNPNDPTVYGPRDDYSPRLSDVWALGVLFLNLLFAQSPWTDPSRESCFKFCQFLREGAGFLVGQFPKLPREVADFLVTRVFSPESGRCNVLEFKQWVHALGYPFNPLKPGATAPRPINSRHKSGGAQGPRRTGGGSAGRSMGSGSYGKKPSPGSLTHHSFTKLHNGQRAAQATTAVALENVVVSANDTAQRSSFKTSKSPHSKKDVAAAGGAHAAKQTGDTRYGPSLMPLAPAAKHNLSTSVPALVFSQIIPATQAATARKMMPREHNPVAAKAAAALLQSSMLCLPKNGLGQGKEDDNTGLLPTDDNGEDDDGHSSWNQLDSLSEAEDEDNVDIDSHDGRPTTGGYRASAVAVASKFPTQSIAASLGVSLAKGSAAAFDSDEEMDFSVPLSFEDVHKSSISAHVPSLPAKSTGADGAATAVASSSLKKSLTTVHPVSASAALDNSYSDELDILGHFSEEEEDGAVAPLSASAAVGQQTAGHRVRFNEMPHQPAAILPLGRPGRVNNASTNSTDSSLTATLVTSSVEYYSPHMKSPHQQQPSLVAAGTGAAGYADESDADDEADGSRRQQKMANGTVPLVTSPRSTNHHAHRHHRQPPQLQQIARQMTHTNDLHQSPVMRHRLPSPAKKGMRSPQMIKSVPAPANPFASNPLFADEQTSFSWADDAEDLPIINSIAAQIASTTIASGAGVHGDTDTNTSAEDQLSDELPWAFDDQNQHSDGMFAMEL